MKIAQVCPRYYPHVGGVEIHVKEISERLVNKGFEVEVLTTDPSGKLPKKQEKNGVTVKRFKSLAPENIYYFSRHLLSSLMKVQCDILHIHNYACFPTLAAAIAKKNRKLVFTPHYFSMGSFAMGSSKILAMAHIPYLTIGIQIFRSANRIVCVSEEERRVVMKRFLVKAQKMTYIPNGIDYRKIADSHPLLNDSKFRIINIGRLSREKDLKTLIRACKEIGCKIPDMQLMFVGDGPEEKKLRKFVHGISLKDVLWVGKVPHEKVGAYLKSASLFVLPSSREVFPLSILEAYAAGVPTIISDAINLNVVKNGSLFFKKGDEKDLANKIFKVYKEKDLRKILIQRGKDFARLFDWNEIVDRLVKLYYSIVYEHN